MWMDGTRSVFPDWVQINFNGAKKIDRVVLFTIPDTAASTVDPSDSLTFSMTGITGYTVETWNGTGWVTQATITGNNLVKRTVVFAAVTTDRIRVNVTSDVRGDYSYVAEIEAWTAAEGTPPAAPTIGTATAGNASATVTFTPGALGTGTLVNYTADCGGITANGAGSPINVTGLTNGTSYNCKVKTTSSVGTSTWSALSNAVIPAATGTPPAAPTVGTATAGNASVSVAFTPGALGTGTLVNYTADCGGITATGANSPITVTGLTNGSGYTCKVKTTTTVGTSAWSALSNAVTPGGSASPGTPAIGTATAGNASVSLTFTRAAWVNNSGSFLNFTADCNGITATGGLSSTGNALPITVIGLTNGTPYTCKVKTVMTGGTSAWSALSNTVTPSASNGGINAALASQGGVATASNTAAGYSPTYANDNDRIGFVSGNAYGWVNTSSSAWLQIQFSGYKTIDRVVLVSAQDNWNATAVEPTNTLLSDYYTGGFSVQTWNGANWTERAHVYANDMIKRTVFFPSVTTDRIRIVTDNSPMRVVELEAWTAPSPTPPAVPMIGYADPGDTRATVFFTPTAVFGSGSFVSYLAKCMPRTGNANFPPQTATGTSSPITVTGLQNDALYDCKVLTVSSVGVSDWSSTALVHIGTPPAAPTIGTATAGNASATVTFTPGALGTGTLVNYTADCGGITATGANSPITVTGLTNGTSYNCKVKTITTVGTSAWSALSNAVTPVNAGTPPSAPSIGTAIALNASASVHFTPGAQGAGALVNYTADCGGITTSTTSAPITVTGLTNGSTYTCKVKTTTTAGTSAWSALSNAVIPLVVIGNGTAPSAPIIDSASAGNASASVAFAPGALGSGTFVNYTADCNGITANGISSPINVIGLTNGVSYTCKVKTVSTWGTSPWSALSNAVTPAVSVSLPTAPTMGSATSGVGSASVSFTLGNLGSGALVNHTAACGAFAANGANPPITVTGLTNGTSYTCKVRTATTAGVSPWSAPSNTVVPDVAEPPVTYFHNDISGSPMLATDGAGAVIWKENYRPYGERLNNQAGSHKNKLGFAGKQFDAATGLSYMGARYYDPVLGRFMGVDPVDYQESNIHSSNRYAYANNNPYRYIDPDGRNPVAAIAWAAFEAVAWLGARHAATVAVVETGAALATGAVVPSVVLGGAVAKSAGQLGREGEALASRITGVGKNTESFLVNGRTRIPDQVISQDLLTRNPLHLVEVKNVKSQSLTRQLRDDIDLVGPGGRVDVMLPSGATASGPLQRAFDNPLNPLNRVDLK